MGCRRKPASRLPGKRDPLCAQSFAENLFVRTSEQNVDRKLFLLVFVRRLLPLKLIRIKPANLLNDFDRCHERLKTVSIDHVQLRAVTKFAAKLVESRLKIIF